MRQNRARAIGRQGDFTCAVADVARVGELKPNVTSVNGCSIGDRAGKTHANLRLLGGQTAGQIGRQSN